VRSRDALPTGGALIALWPRCRRTSRGSLASEREAVGERAVSAPCWRRRVLANGYARVIVQRGTLPPWTSSCRGSCAPPRVVDGDLRVQLAVPTPGVPPPTLIIASRARRSSQAEGMTVWTPLRGWPMRVRWDAGRRPPGPCHPVRGAIILSSAGCGRKPGDGGCPAPLSLCVDSGYSTVTDWPPFSYDDTRVSALRFQIV